MGKSLMLQLNRLPSSVTVLITNSGQSTITSDDLGAQSRTSIQHILNNQLRYPRIANGQTTKTKQ
jgi:hypothetical protein